MKCLNNFKNVRLKQEHDVNDGINEAVIIKEEITIEEHNIEFVPVNNYFDETNATNVIIFFL